MHSVTLTKLQPDNIYTEPSSYLFIRKDGQLKRKPDQLGEIYT
jgi:hypothetical protein